MSGAARLAATLVGACFALAGAACGPDAVKPDRTEGLELEYLWTDSTEYRAAYYVVSRDGEFRSAGGRKARERETTFGDDLSDADARRFVELLRATDFESRPDEAGAGAQRSEVVVRASGERHRFTVLGADRTLDALREWLASRAMRQYRDVLEAQPQAGPRRR